MQQEQVYDQASESAVLSCFLHAQLDEQREMLSTLREDHFHLYEHKLIFQSFLRVIGKGIHADFINIKSDLDANGTIEDIGGDTVLAEIAAYCQNSHNWKRYFPQLEEARYRRSLEFLASDMIHKARDRELKLEELKNWSETSVMRADYSIDDTEKLSVKSVVDRALDNIESTMRGEPRVGIRTGLVPVDDLLMFGMRGGDMIVLAARPAVGKTSAAMQIAEHVALDAQKRVLIFSLEMTSVSLMERMIRSRARVRAADILAQSITKYQRESLSNAYNEVKESHILCDDTSGKSIGYIKAVARRAHQKEPLDLIIIDYLQLLRGDSKRAKDNRVNEVEEISGGIKELAKNLKVPVLVLAQLNRDPEKRGGRPSLSDLKGSGCISGDSQILYRNRISKIEDLTNDADSGSVASMTSSNNIQYARAKKAWLTKKSEQAYSLTLSTGHSIVATANHKFLSKNGWFPLESFGVGDMLAIPLNMASESMDTVSLAEARILAAFIANGCCLERRSLQITLNSNDSDIAESLIKDIKEVFGDSIVPRISVEGHESRSGNSWIQLYLPARERSARGRENPVITFLKKHGLYNKRAKEKSIPQEIFFQKKETIYAFLAMLFACDGSCCICYTTPKKRRFVVASYASASKQLIDGVQLMLQSIGIVAGVSKVKCRGFISYTLQVYSRSFKNRFASLVGFSGKRKQATMQDVVEKMNAAPLGYEKYIQDGDVVFVPIKSIEDAGKIDVYDMEVPKNHNFVANGILAHNSIEQDADIVMMLHCDEADSKNHTQTPTVEFIVAKHREGPTGIAPMTFNKAITRFEISSNNGRES